MSNVSQSKIVYIEITNLHSQDVFTLRSVITIVANILVSPCAHQTSTVLKPRNAILSIQLIPQAIVYKTANIPLTVHPSTNAKITFVKIQLCRNNTITPRNKITIFYYEILLVVSYNQPRE